MLGSPRPGLADEATGHAVWCRCGRGVPRLRQARWCTCSLWGPGGLVQVALVPSCRVLVVDDHQVFTQTLAELLSRERDLVVVATAFSGAEGERLAEERRPDVVVLDLELGDRDGLEVASRLLERRPSSHIVVLSAHSEPLRVCQALRVGVAAFVAKEARHEELLAAIRGAGRGETWIAPRLLTGVLHELLRPPPDSDPRVERFARLSRREREVLACLVTGLDRAAIAERLVVSINTVRTHVRNVLAKLEVHSSLEAVALAARVNDRRAGTHRRLRLPHQA